LNDFWSERAGHNNHERPEYDRRNRKTFRIEITLTNVDRFYYSSDDNAVSLLEDHWKELLLFKQRAIANELKIKPEDENAC
jgi:hypothetical protein